jgi:hypothetical protein
VCYFAFSAAFMGSHSNFPPPSLVSRSFLSAQQALDLQSPDTFSANSRELAPREFEPPAGPQPPYEQQINGCGAGGSTEAKGVVMAYLVTQRTREIGVRLALGAPPAQVMTAVIGRGVVHTAAGVVIGVAVAWVLATSVEAFLFEVRSHDPVVYGAAAALLAACGVAAAFVPARRAARVDPVIALRVE